MVYLANANSGMTDIREIRIVPTLASPSSVLVQHLPLFVCVCVFVFVFVCVISLQQALKNLLKISPKSIQNRSWRRLGGIEVVFLCETSIKLQKKVVVLPRREHREVSHARTESLLFFRIEGCTVLFVGFSAAEHVGHFTC